MSVLLTLQVATGGREGNQESVGRLQGKLALLKRRCSLEGKIWWLM
jgi:hypothetical protein